MVPLPPAPRALPGRVEEEEERAGKHHDQRDDERREVKRPPEDEKKEKKKAVNRTVLTNCSNKENMRVCDNLFFVRKKILDTLAVQVSPASLYPAILFWSKKNFFYWCIKDFVTKLRANFAQQCQQRVL